jgi:hypothetical protein
VKRARTLPGVEESTSYGTAAIKAKGKFIGRLKEDGESMVLRVDFLVRDHLMHAQPEVFYITDHYKNYPAVLIRLAAADADQVQELVESAWRASVPAKLVAQHEAGTATPPKRAPKTPPSRARAPSPPSARGRRGA